ncbi:hypothetical protein BHM03_00058294, partial [Ensete ventricosum]
LFGSSNNIESPIDIVDVHPKQDWMYSFLFLFVPWYVRRVCYKVFRSKLYRPIQVVCIGLTGYWYVDRPLLGGTIKTGVSPRRNKATLHLLARDEAMPPSPRRNETTPHLPVRDEASPPLPARDEAMPPLPRRNEATSCLPARDEATPRLLAGEARENKVPPLLPVR